MGYINCGVAYILTKTTHSYDIADILTSYGVRSKMGFDFVDERILNRVPSKIINGSCHPLLQCKFKRKMSYHKK